MSKDDLIPEPFEIDDKRVKETLEEFEKETIKED